MQSENAHPGPARTPPRRSIRVDADRPSPRANKWRDLGDVGAVGIEFVLSIVLCYALGHYLDGRYFGGRGWATWIGAILGVLTAFKAIYDANRRMKIRLAEVEAADAERANAPEEPWDRHRRSDGRRVD